MVLVLAPLFDATILFNGEMPLVLLGDLLGDLTGLEFPI